MPIIDCGSYHHPCALMNMFDMRCCWFTADRTQIVLQLAGGYTLYIGDYVIPSALSFNKLRLLFLGHFLLLVGCRIN